MREWNAPIKVSLGKRHTESLFLAGLACLASGCDLFFSFSNFFDKLARKSLLPRLSRVSLVSFPTDWGGTWKFWNTWSYKFDSFKGIIPKPALRDSKNFWIKRYTHLYKFVADFHARFLVFLFIVIICRLIYQFVGLSLFVGRLWFAHG